MKKSSRDEERSDSALLIPGGVRAIAGGGFVPARAQGRREEAYSSYAARPEGRAHVETGPHRAIAVRSGACAATILPRRISASGWMRAESSPSLNPPEPYGAMASAR